MPSRAELELRAAAVNVTLTPNDSVLEQRVLNAEKNLTASVAATTQAAPASARQLSGDKNV